MAAISKLTIKFSVAISHKIQCRWLLLLQLGKCAIPRLSFEYVLGGQQPFNASFERI